MWKGNFFRLWHDWWKCGDHHDIQLNTLLEISVLAFMDRQYTDSEIEEKIMEYVHGLPPEAISCSDRLRDGKYNEIQSVVRRDIKKGFDGEPNPKLSRWIFSEIRHNCSWFDPGDPSTWSKTWANVEKSDLKFDWGRVPGLVPYWMAVLKVKEAEVVRRFLDAAVNLAVDKEREGRGFGRVYFQKWVRDKFPEIKVGYIAKVQKILTELDGKGIIQRTRIGFRPAGKAKGECSRWEKGWQAEQLLEVAASPSNPTPQLDIYSFCSISDSSFETCSVEVLDSGEVRLHQGSDWNCPA